LQGQGQLGFPVEELIDHHFLIAAGQDAPHLSPAPVALVGEIALGGKRRLGAAGQSTHIDIEYLPGVGIVVPIALALLAIDRGQRLLHLGHVLGASMIKRLLHHRLFGTVRAAKGALQRPVGAQSRIDLDDAVRTGQDGDESVIQFVSRRVFHGFLRDLHSLTHWAKQIQVVKFGTNRGQTGTGRTVLADCGRLVHDGSPVVGWRTYR